MWHNNCHGALFELKYFEHSFEVYKAGPALDIRFHKTTTMLAGIRDPDKNVKLIVFPEGLEDATGLPVLVVIAVLLKSKKSLENKLEARNIKHRYGEGGIDCMFRATRRDTVLDMGGSAVVGKDYHPEHQ
ncbi:hypothetical protein CALCODRAFT_332922 [Calocera cornea HHB12733]|uniref:Uncharacterized protein n=1 Tax=Calocera cornea HHB12733 TaxID=1353952 RepID=A0A165F1J0_9BASI|nr:hypothetical protein CALCODRAFT_332922 [Calocera cornea HHB12733]